MTELNGKVRELPDGEEKDAIKEEIAILAIEADEWFRNEMRDNSQNPYLTVSYSEFDDKVQRALIDLDDYAGDYSFKPTTYTPTSYEDPKNKTKEYILTPEQKDQYKTFYTEVYNEIMGKVINSRTYQSADDEERASMLEEAREDIPAKTREKLIKWMQDNGVKSTPKED